MSHCPGRMHQRRGFTSQSAARAMMALDVHCGVMAGVWGGAGRLDWVPMAEIAPNSEGNDTGHKALCPVSGNVSLAIGDMLSTLQTMWVAVGCKVLLLVFPFVLHNHTSAVSSLLRYVTSTIRATHLICGRFTKPLLFFDQLLSLSRLCG